MAFRGWRRGQVIGRGASATVSIATSESSGEVFAVKSCELARSAFLRREQSILSALDSPFVVSYLGFEVGASCNLFMEYAPGGSLSDEIKKQGGRLDEVAIRSYARDVLAGLAYLHSLGVVHCDVKSDNVLVCADGRGKLADFGCARRAGEKGEGECLMGTPMFMAPEVARGEEQGAPADIWALGCTVIEMATGRPPWPLVADPVAALHRIAFSGDVPEFPSWISEEGNDFLSRCLRREAGDRWTAERLLQHPFVASCTPSLSERVSPKSALDQTFWGMISDDDDEGEGEGEVEDACERVQSLFGSGAHDWEWDENWVTVRSHGQEGSFPATQTATTNPIAASEELVLEVAHSSIECGSVDNNCNFDDDECGVLIEDGTGEHLIPVIIGCKKEINWINKETIEFNIFIRLASAIFISIPTSVTLLYAFIGQYFNVLMNLFSSTIIFNSYCCYSNFYGWNSCLCILRFNIRRKY